MMIITSLLISVMLGSDLKEFTPPRQLNRILITRFSAPNLHHAKNALKSQTLADVFAEEGITLEKYEVVKVKRCGSVLSNVSHLCDADEIQIQLAPGFVRVTVQPFEGMAYTCVVPRGTNLADFVKVEKLQCLMRDKLLVLRDVYGMGEEFSEEDLWENYDCTLEDEDSISFTDEE